MKIFFKSFGCRTNQIEVESLKQHLILDGFQISKDLNNTDLVIINSCCVTQKAEDEVEKFLDKILNKGHKFVVFTGCLATLKPDYFSKKGVVVFKNDEKHLIYNFITKKDKDLSSFPIIKTGERTRAFVKIQDGCKMGCSYCIVPKLRTKLKSKSFDMILSEVKNLIQSGVKEIVLSGIRLGSYNDNGKTLKELVKSIIRIPVKFRLRYSSIEIWEIDEELIDLSMDEKICKYFHIPLQSGSDKILRLMKRPYTKKYFEEKINLIRKKIPKIGIYSDVIVGFPYETDDDYNETERFIKDLSLSGLHVFSFSKRPYTEAFFMKENSKKIIEERSKKMHELDRFLRDRFLSSFVGSFIEILTIKRKDNNILGLSSEFIDVLIEENLKLNELYKLYSVSKKDKYLVCKKQKDF